MMGRGTRVVAAVAGTYLSMAAHAVSPPPVGADRAAAALEDTCAESPFDSEYETRSAFLALWDGDDYREPFTLGPVQEGVTTPFGTASQSVYRSGRVQITIRLDDAYGWDRSRTFKLVARSLASLPGPLMQRLPPANLNLTQFYAGDDPQAPASAYFDGSCTGSPDHGYTCDGEHSVQVPDSFFVLADDGTRPVPIEQFEKTLIHEFAHVLDLFAWHAVLSVPGTNRWSRSDDWQRAMAESACAVSEYATTNAREDFAESVVAWFAYYAGRQGRLPPEAREALRERLGKRFGVLNKLMHDRFVEGGE